ncbi:MAG: hypothetical protein ACTSXE_02565 [Candidatus Thorarchaeota archaeon]
MSFKRNTQAEESAFVLIPKDSLLAVGIEQADPYINTMNRGDHKGRVFDKYKLKLRILEQGDYYNKIVSVSLSALIERRQSGSEVETIAYGNSRKYCEMLRAINPSLNEDDVPSPESDSDIDTFADIHFVGKVVYVKFGTYNFKGDDGNKVEINIIKETESLTDEMTEVLKPHIAKWEAQMTASRAGVTGAAGDFNPEDWEGE